MEGEDLLFEASPFPSFVSDRETLRILAVNKAMRDRYGWTREEFLELTLLDIRSPGEIARLHSSMATAPEAPDATYSRTGRHRTKDGRELVVDMTITRLVYGGRPAALAVCTDITGIADAERRFRLLVENSVDGIALTDEEQHVLYLSPGAERMLGLKKGELVGQKCTALTHPDDLAAAHFPRMPGATTLHVARSRHADGSWRWLETITTNLTHDPAVRACVANFRDITERQVAVHAMQETQTKLEYLLSATSAITYQAKLDGSAAVMLFIGPNVRKILGHEPEAFHASPSFWVESIHPEDRETVGATRASSIERGELSIEYRVRHADGTYRWIQDVAHAVRDERHGHVLVGYWIDVTERRQAEASVRRSEASFRTLIERSPASIFVHRQGWNVYANRAAVAMLGASSADEVVGREMLDLIHPDDRAFIRGRMRNTIEQGWTAPVEARMLRTDGAPVAVEAEAVLLDFDGESSSVVLARDVGERRELFARMAMADRMLSVGTLAAGVAHEINNPLAYVLANLAVLDRDLRRRVDGESTALLDRDALVSALADAREGAERVRSIVLDLRALSRADDESTRAVDVKAVLASSIKMAHAEIRHRARVIEEHADDLPPVQASASRLGQVFLNLLLNAAHAIPEGHVETNEIRVRSSLGAEGVVISIEDTGEGIAPSVLPRIFDPFFTTKPIGVGVGLGLSITHQIVKSFHGNIEVASTVGRGSTFRVTLPIATSPVAEAEPVASATGVARARVLMIDDEPAVGRSTQLLLAPEHEVVAVTRARDALARLAAGERFDVILCDLMMPETSGVEFFEQLSESVPEQAERVVFLTGGAFTLHTNEFLAKLTRPHLDKPFTERALREIIERVRG